MACCRNCRETSEATSKSFDLEHLEALRNALDGTDVVSAAVSAAARITRRLVITKRGNVFLKAGFVADGTGFVVSMGNVGALPYRAIQRVSFDGTALSATFSLEQPVRIEYSTRFEATGVVRNDAGTIVSVSGFRPAESQSHTEISLGTMICIVQCGGEAVLDAALDCAGDIYDPPAFVACIAEQVALDPETSACIEGCLTG